MSNDNTMWYKADREKEETVRSILGTIYEALTEKGYNPVNQLVGYIISGDPTYITSNKNARSLITKIERDELLEELVKYYVHQYK